MNTTLVFKSTKTFLQFLFLFCFIMGNVAFAQQDKLDENLRTAIKRTDAVEYLKVSIILTEKSSRAELQGLVNNKKKEEKRQLVVSYLKQFTKSKQKALLDELHSYQIEGLAKDIRPLWIVNIITAKLSGSIINNLAQRQDVEKLVLEKSFHAGSSTTWSVDSVKAPTVWSDMNITGDDVLVAILDTGVDYNHTDLSSNIWNNENEEIGDANDDGFPGIQGVDDDGDGLIDEDSEDREPGDQGYTNNLANDDDENGFIDDIRGWNFVSDNSDPLDDNGHGTHVSGIAAGDGSGGTQTGVAPGAKLMALKIWDYNEDGISSDCISAIQYAVANGANVINISGGWLNSEISESIRYNLRETCEIAVDAGVTVVAAAGNNETPIPPNQMDTPASVPCVIAVGAIGSDNAIYVKSANGPVTWFFEPYWENDLIKPDVVAPGNYVNSTKLGGGYKYDTGTSMASPAVAGTVALMFEACPELLPEEIKDILESTALDLPPSGKDNTFGSGRINAYKAVLIALAKNNKSNHSTATGYNGGRRAAVTSDDDLHLVFQSGDEIFYEVSDDDGSSWDSIERLSDGEGLNNANRFPSLTVDDDDNVFAVWQRFSAMDGSNYDYEIWFTSAPNVPTTPIVAANQYSAIPTYYPYPVITYDVDNNHLLVVYYDNTGIRWMCSTNGGSSWSSPSTISGTSGNMNPSIISSEDETYLTYDDLSTVYSRIYTGSGWSSEEDVTDGSGLSSERFSSVAVSKTTGWVTSYKWHVVWQAWDPSESQNVIAYRSREDDSGEWKNNIITIFDNAYTNYHYYYPVVAGGTHSSSDVAAIAWKVGSAGNYRYQKIVDDVPQGTFQSDTGWYPSMTTYLSAAQSTFTDPLIVSADGAAAPYEIKVNSSLSLPKATPEPMIYNRRIIAEYKNSDSSLVFIQLGNVKVHTKTEEEIVFDFVPVNERIELSSENLFNYLNTMPVALDENAESLSFNYTVFTRCLENVLKEGKSDLQIRVNLRESSTNSNLTQFADIKVNEIKEQFIAANKQMEWDVRSFCGKKVYLSVEVENLKLDKEVTLGLAHVYKDAEPSSLDRPKQANSTIAVPDEFSLLTNYPNPFNPETNIQFALPEASQVRIEVMNVLGQRIAVLHDQSMPAGYHTVRWDGRTSSGEKASSGVYFCRMQAGGFVKTIKMMLLP